ncbi:hypothetical protein [Mesorhizobium sp. 1B3]|uniref:hypothetical protein n=1 Tax=Mesorhizobium sp. 1B3 TaxID=3243599 RepID=UPI003D98E1D0
MFDPIAKNFDDALNTEWFVRSYLALKFVLGATVLGNSAEYAEDRNLQVTLPYLGYYTMMNTCRAFLLTLPCVEWRGEKSIEMTHSNILNTTADKLRRLGSGHQARFSQKLLAAKDQRELFSYRFPSTGLSVFGDQLVSVGEAISLGRFLVELSQINLACLEARVARFWPSTAFRMLELEDMWHAMQYEMSTATLIDDEDYHRVGYFVRNYRSPRSLVSMATDGLVDDFFGAWSPLDENADKNSFDADRQCNLLLDIW